MAKSTEFPPLRISRKRGWINLEFALLGHEVEGDDEFHLFCAGASHDGQDIAFNILYPCRWTYDPPEGLPPGILEFQAGMALINAQPLHEAFLQTLARIYGVPVPDVAMANFIEVSAVTLKGDPERVLREPVELKIFFGAFEGAGIPHAELFLEIDVPARAIRLNEKDPEYRGAILEGLSKGTTDDGQQDE